MAFATNTSAYVTTPTTGVNKVRTAVACMMETIQWIMELVRSTVFTKHALGNRNAHNRHSLEKWANRHLYIPF